MLDSEKMAEAIIEQIEEYETEGDMSFSCLNVGKQGRSLGDDYTMFIRPHLSEVHGNIFELDYEGDILQEFRLKLMTEFKEKLISQGR